MDAPPRSYPQLMHAFGLWFGVAADGERVPLTRGAVLQYPSQVIDACQRRNCEPVDVAEASAWRPTKARRTRDTARASAAP